MKLIRLPLALLSSRSLEGVLLAAMLIVLGTAAYRMFSVPGKENAITVRLLAELGSAEAQSRMGVMMAERGNTEEAEEWLLRSVRNGGKSGIPELGRLYLESQSPEKRAEGLSILLRAAGHGSRKARYLLARHSELNGDKLPCYVWNALALDRDAVSDAEPYVMGAARRISARRTTGRLSPCSMAFCAFTGMNSLGRMPLRQQQSLRTAHRITFQLPIFLSAPFPFLPSTRRY